MDTRKVALTISFALLAVGIFLNHRLDRWSEGAKQEISPDEINFVWNPDLFRMVSFGHVPASTDWLLLKFTTASEWKHVKKNQRARPFYDLDLATELDPRFYLLYTAGTNFLSVIRDDNEGACKIIEKGERFRRNELPKYSEEFRKKYWTPEWYIPFTKGFVELFELHDVPMAANTFKVLESLPDVPPHLASLSRSLSDPLKRYDVGERILKAMHQKARTDREKAGFIKRLEDLRIGRFVAEVNLKFEDFAKKKLSKVTSLAELPLPVVEGLYTEAVKSGSVPSRDPAGGSLFVSKNNKIDSVTKRQKVFGMD